MLDFGHVNAVNIPNDGITTGVNRVIDSQNRVVWVKPEIRTPFYIENVGNSHSYVFFKKRSYRGVDITIEYSTDNSTWKTLGKTTTDSSVTNSAIISMNPGDKVYFRAKPLRCWYEGDGDGNIITTGSSSDFKVGGNILSMIYGSSFTGLEKVFPSMFETGYTIGWLMGIFEGWTNLIDASELQLVADHMKHCYDMMFKGCTGLKTPPGIIGGKVADYSCNEMFRGCTSLLKSPVIAHDGALYTYRWMFKGCSMLSEIRCYAGRDSSSNFLEWVDGVAASGTFYKKAGVEWPTGVSGIPSGWTVRDL